jgi:hypothetical protein
MARSFETIVTTYHSIGCHSPEDHNLNLHPTTVFGDHLINSDVVVKKGKAVIVNRLWRLIGL